jgi:hypothetical protein
MWVRQRRLKFWGMDGAPLKGNFDFLTATRPIFPRPSPVSWEREGIWGERLRGEKLPALTKMKVVNSLHRAYAWNVQVPGWKMGRLVPPGVQRPTKYGPLDIPTWAVLDA